jgi:hypothetical protein
MKADEPIDVGPQGVELAIDPAVMERLEGLIAALAAHGTTVSVGELVEFLLKRATAQLDLATLKKLVKEALARESQEAQTGT